MIGVNDRYFFGVNQKLPGGSTGLQKNPSINFFLYASERTHAFLILSNTYIRLYISCFYSIVIVLLYCLQYEFGGSCQFYAFVDTLDGMNDEWMIDWIG